MLVSLSSGAVAVAGLARLLLDVGPGDEPELLDERREPRRPDLQAPPAHDVLEGLGERRRRSATAAPDRARARGRGRARTSSGTRADVRSIGREVGVADAHQDVELLAAAEERPQDEHLGEHDAEREEIAPRVELAPDDLLGRHVPELAFELPGVGAPLDLGRARDAEVGELHRARAIDEHVARRHVAVHERERACPRRRARRGRTRARAGRESVMWRQTSSGMSSPRAAAARMSRAPVVPSTYSIAM